jgi:hypothetical protein
MGRRRSRSEDLGDDDEHAKRLYGDDDRGSGRKTRSVEPPRNRTGSYDDDDGGSRKSKKKKKSGGVFTSFFGSSKRGGASTTDTSFDSRPESARRPDRMHGQSPHSVSDIERLAQKKGANPKNERFKVLPDMAYPNTHWNREQLREEMNRKSTNFHDLRPRTVSIKKSGEIGQLRLEILQCFGLPTASMIREPQAYCMAVLGSFAFKSDVMPAVANPMWLAKMRRACIFPIHVAYAKCYVGVFDNGAAETSQNASDFIGRVVIDVARLRPGCIYDITLPLRQSAHVFTRVQQGAVRVRIQLDWLSERAAIMSYIPAKVKTSSRPDTSQTISCLDEKSFRNVAHAVHGSHMPGKFSMTLLKSTIREVNFTRIHVLRYIRRRELHNLRYWVYPFISGFVFSAWMHAVVFNTVRYIPGHILTFLLLHLYKNYAYYGMDSVLQNGFMAPTFEELLKAVLWGSRRRRFVQPLHMEVDEKHAINPMEHIEADDDYDEANKDAIPIYEIAESMRKSLKVTTTKHRLRTYKDCFLGREAVDFLVSFGFAFSRGEAVALGRRLQREVHLFRHISNSYDFDDEDHYFQFLDYDSKKYVIKGHMPQGKRILHAVGFMKDSEGLIESQGHVEFPYATGADVPRFSVKQSLVIRSSEAKKYLKEHEQALDSLDIAEFGVIEHGNQNQKEDEEPQEENVIKRNVRRASIMAGAAAQTAMNMPGAVINAPGAIAKTVMNAPGAVGAGVAGLGNAVVGVGGAVGGVVGGVVGTKRHNMEFGETAELYDKLEERQNPTLDELIEEQKNANTYDKYEYDSDDDVDDVKKTRQKQYIIEEKHLKKPPNQDFSQKARSGDKSLTKSISDARHKAHGLLLHAFNDQVYKVDPHLFPTIMAETDNLASVSTKKGRFGKKRRKASMNHSEDSRKKARSTPYDTRLDELDKVLQIKKHSHGNPWINRVGVIIQPLVEVVQVGLFLFRAVFNVMTWQDPILSFWLGFGGPMVVLLLHFAPWRLFFFVSGIAFVGPQNYVIRFLNESRPDYEPPDFDKLVKKKKKQKEENYDEIQFFSSQAPGNQQVKYKDVDPKEVKQVVVPNHMLMHTPRFYDWPPEPAYAKVYSSRPGAHQNEDEDDMSESNNSNDAYWFDPALAKKKKKKKKGLKKVAAQAKKGAGAVVSGTLDVGGTVLERSKGTTVGLARVTTKVTKKAVKGTGHAVIGTASRLRNRKSIVQQYDDEESD